MRRAVFGVWVCLAYFRVEVNLKCGGVSKQSSDELHSRPGPRSWEMRAWDTGENDLRGFRRS